MKIYKNIILMYRSTPHSTTLRAPTKLIFRNTRDKLPSIEQKREWEGELYDRDTEMKAKGREYIDHRRAITASINRLRNEILYRVKRFFFV